VIVSGVRLPFATVSTIYEGTSNRRTVEPCDALACTGFVIMFREVRALTAFGLLRRLPQISWLSTCNAWRFKGFSLRLRSTSPSLTTWCVAT
jgi:hypothetical protein